MVVTTSEDYLFEQFQELPEFEKIITDNSYSYTKRDDRIPTAPENTAVYWYMYLKQYKAQNYRRKSFVTKHYQGMRTHDFYHATQNFNKCYEEHKVEQRFINIENRLSALETQGI